jgi:hypothetical protein
MCTVESRTVSYRLFGFWVASLYEAKHTDRAHSEEDNYMLVGGDDSRELTAEEFHNATTAFSLKFTVGVVSRDEDDCWLDDETDEETK